MKNIDFCWNNIMDENNLGFVKEPKVNEIYVDFCEGRVNR